MSASLLSASRQLFHCQRHVSYFNVSYSLLSTSCQLVSGHLRASLLSGSCQLAACRHLFFDILTSSGAFLLTSGRPTFCLRIIGVLLIVLYIGICYRVLSARLVGVSHIWLQLTTMAASLVIISRPCSVSFVRDAHNSFYVHCSDYRLTRTMGRNYGAVLCVLHAETAIPSEQFFL